jgi:hypothetical protein
MTTNKDTCILLFVKYPESGKVKLRLTADLNEDIVLELYRCFVHDTLETVKKIDSQLFICYSPADAQKKFQRWLGSNLLFLPQNGVDLGERMKNCFTTVFEKGFGRVILMGSDSPDIPEDSITQAFSMLKTKDVVLGPAVDGGYYLIGLHDTTFIASLFEELPWGTQVVLEETLKRTQQASRTVGLLSTWSDVDTISDLKNLVIRAKNTSFKSSQTMTYIHKHLTRLEDDNGD